MPLDVESKDVEAIVPKESQKDASSEHTEIQWGKPATSINEQTETQWGKPASVPTLAGQIQDWGDAKNSSGSADNHIANEQRTHFNESEERKEVLNTVP